MRKLPNLLQKGRSYYFSKTRNGNREYHWLGTTDSADFMILLKYDEWKQHYETREDDFGRLSEAWLKHRSKEVFDGLLMRSTLNEYKKHVRPGSRMETELGKKPLNQLTTPEIQAYVDTGKRYQSNRELATLKQMLGWGVNRGMLKNNPALGVKRNKEAPRDRYVTNEEFRLVYQDMPEPIQDLMMLSYLTGLRVGDVLALTYNAIHEDYLCAIEGKTRKKVRFVWSHSLRAIVERIKERNAGYNPSEKMIPLTVSYASKIFRAHFPEDVDHWVLKDLRAKSATDREEPQMASYALGHGSQSLTNRHYLRNQKGRIVAPVDSELESLSP